MNMIPMYVATAALVLAMGGAYRLSIVAALSSIAMTAAYVLSQ